MSSRIRTWPDLINLHPNSHPPVNSATLGDANHFAAKRFLYPIKVRLHPIRPGPPHFRRPGMRSLKESAVPSVDSTIQLIQINEQQGTQNQTSTCSSALADAPWTFDAEPTYG